VFVFAHQDDEMAAVTRIPFELGRGADVHCVYLTDGALKVASSVRNGESLMVLSTLGVSPDRVHFLGSMIPIRDGALVYRMDDALEHLTAAMKDVPVKTIFALAWEGGHPDHDASHLVAAAFAKSRGVLDHCYELMLYRGTAAGRLFRVFSPHRRAEWTTRPFDIGEGLRAAFIARHYRSQRRSWLGLFAESFFKLAVMRREMSRPLDVTRLRTRPPGGTLFYERRFHLPYSQFEKAASTFIQRHFG
jgi:LmbE family N-acetylglucosaminyl deacetylase